MRFVTRLFGRLLRWGLILALIAVVALPLLLLGAAVQRNPLVGPQAALSPSQAAESHAFAKRLREASRGTEGVQTVSATAAELDGLMATGARLWPGLRGETRIDRERLVMAMSAPMPVGGLWANFALAVGPSEGPLAVQVVRVGRVALPPAQAVAATRWTLDALTTADLGTLLMDAVQAVRLAPGEVTARIDGGGLGEASLFSRLVDGARGLLGLEAGERAAEHYRAMADAAARGELPSRGSVAPWLRFAVQRVAEAGHESGRALRQDLRAAVLAAAAHCGDASVVGTVAGDIGASGRSACGGTTLRGRADLRKHFMLSAAFAATGGSSVSWGLGEMKELVDAGRERGSGFSFDDVALDRAGIAFAERLRTASLGEARSLAARIEEEAAIAPAIDGLPSFMPASEFAARFGDVEDPRYHAMLAEIDARIAALPFLAP